MGWGKKEVGSRRPSTKPVSHWVLLKGSWRLKAGWVLNGGWGVPKTPPLTATKPCLSFPILGSNSDHWFTLPLLHLLPAGFLSKEAKTCDP